MKINQCNNDEEINEYFEQEDTKLWKKHGFVVGEMIEIHSYCREFQELLSKCGDRMNVLKTRNVQIANHCVHCMGEGVTQPIYLDGDYEDCPHCSPNLNNTKGDDNE